MAGCGSPRLPAEQCSRFGSCRRELAVKVLNSSQEKLKKSPPVNRGIYLKTAALIFITLTAFSGAASAFPVQCESDDFLIGFDFEHLGSIANYTFALKSAPERKQEIAAPLSRGQGLFDVSLTSESQDFLELPPSVSRENVKQFPAAYTSEPIENPEDAEQIDILCHKP